MPVIYALKHFPKILCRPFGFASALLLLFAPAIGAQQPASSPPATDTSTLSSPLIDPASPPSVDASTNASPLRPLSSADSIPSGATLHVRLMQPLDSATTHNGQEIRCLLTQPVRTSSGRTLPAGTPVDATIIAALPAGVITSAGEISLQVTQVGSIPVLSNILERQGEPGPRLLPDSAPQKGTEATFAEGAGLSFTIPSLPTL